MVATLAGLLGVLTLGLLSPGPDFLLVLRNSLGHTRARGLGTVAGITIGLAVQTGVIAGGFAALPTPALRIIQLCGAAYLAWLGFRALLARASTDTFVERHPSADAFALPTAAAAAARQGCIDGLVCNLTNPKAFLFFVGLFAQIVPPGTPLAWRIALPVAITLHGAILWTLVVLALRSPPVAARLQQAQHWLPHAFGLLLLLLAAWLGYESFAH